MISFLPFMLTLGVWQQPDALAPPPKPQQAWTRRSEGENIVSLDLASRRYTADGKPDVWLIGVAHIAEQSFYDEVTALLDEMDIVLYESVRPTGSRPPSGSTEEEQVQSTRKALAFVANVAKQCAENSNNMPATLLDVIIEAALLDGRLSGWVEDASVDAWGRPFSLQVEESTKTITILSFGSDGAIGGTGAASDLKESRIVKIKRGGLDSVEESKQKNNIQQELADAMDLEFQLEALSYEDPNWFCSDLTMDEVKTKLIEQGADTSLLEMITGESFSAQIATSMMKLIPMLDSLAGGGIRETAKLLMIELLSMPDSDQLLEGLEPELAHVIIVERNTELLNDLAATMGIAEDLSTIGVLYGAGHMPDLSRRLRSRFGYAPAEERWFKTMSVDPSASLIGEKDLKRMRIMLQYQLYKARERLNGDEPNKE